MQRLTLTLAAAFVALAADANAQANSVTLTGFVSSPNGLTAGPFLQAQTGDAVRLEFEVQVPGTFIGPVVQYAVDPASVALSIGGAQEAAASASAPVLTFSGGPNPSLLAAGIPSVASGNIDIVVVGAGAFNSPEIEFNVGSYDLSSFPAARVTVGNAFGELEVQLTQLDIAATGPVGVAYCAPVSVNSTGFAATLSGRGVANVSANDLTLSVESAPPGTSLLFLASRLQGFFPTPGGSQGNLCLGGQIGRFNASIQVVSAVGTAELVLDLGQIVQPSGLVAAQPGETWNFQAWYRDQAPTQTSNFTNGLSVLLQ